MILSVDSEEMTAAIELALSTIEGSVEKEEQEKKFQAAFAKLSSALSMVEDDIKKQAKAVGKALAVLEAMEAELSLRTG